MFFLQDEGGAWEARLWDDFGALPPRCLRALAAAEAENVELGADWFAHLARTALDAGERAGLYELRRPGAGHAAALLPVRWLPARRDRPGGRLRSLSNFYTSLYAPILTGTEGAAALAALFHHLGRAGWSALRLAPLAKDAPAWRDTLAGLKRAGWTAFDFFCHGNWYLPVAGRAYADYVRGLSSRTRNTVRRREKRFLDDGRGRLEIVTGGAGLDDAIDAWARIYRASWKRPEPYPDFMPGLIRLCAARGWLRLGLAHHDGAPVAAQVWIASPGAAPGSGHAAIYKLAYDERVAHLSAGTVLTAHLMRHALDVDRVAEVDYLIGDDPYKQDWMSHRRERWGIIAYNPRTAAGLAAAAAEAARRLGKRLLGGRSRPEHNPGRPPT